MKCVLFKRCGCIRQTQKLLMISLFVEKITKLNPGLDVRQEQ